MRAFLYALVAAVLLLLTTGAGWLWFDSRQNTTQLLLQSGGSRMVLISADRERIAFLLARGEAQPVGGRVIRAAAGTGPLLDGVCDDHLGGFGLDTLVRREGLVGFEANALLTGQENHRWRAKRLVLPLWALVVGVGGLLAVWWLRFNLPLYRELRGRCRRCANDIRSSSHFCPLCKHPLPKRTWSGPAQAPNRVGRE